MKITQKAREKLLKITSDKSLRYDANKSDKGKWRSWVYKIEAYGHYILMITDFMYDTRKEAVDDLRKIVRSIQDGG